MSIQENNGSIPVESITGAVAVIDSNHAQVHMKRAFEVNYSKSLAASGLMILSFAIPAGVYVHFQAARLIHSGPVKVDFFEDSSGVGAGVALVPTPKHRINSVASQVTIKKDHTDTLGGQKVFEPLYLGHAATANKSSIGGATGDNSEWVLKAGSTYVMRITNLDGATAYNTALTLFWYEEPSA